MGFSDIYANYLAAKMYEFQRSNSFCDATILLDNVQLKVHSVVLAAASPKLKMMIECLKAASKPLTLEMAGCTSEVAEIMLEYMYTGNVVGWHERKKEWSDLIKLFTLLEIPLPDVSMDQENGTIETPLTSTQPDGCNVLRNKQFIISKSLEVSESSRNNHLLKLISFPLNISNTQFQGKTENTNGNLGITKQVVLNTSLITKARSGAVTKPGELQRVGAKEFIIQKRNLPKPSFNFFKTEANTAVVRNNNNNNYNTFSEKNECGINREELVSDIKTSYSPLPSSSATAREVLDVSPQTLNFSSSVLHNHHADLESTLHDIESGVIQFPEVTSDISVDVTGCQVFDVTSYHNLESNVDVNLEKYVVEEGISHEVPPVLLSSSGKPIRSRKSIETSDVESLEDSKKVGAYECGECKRVFQSNAALLTHMRCHRKKIPQVCSECHQIFGYPVFLSRHMFDKHGMFACPKCGNNCVCPPEKAKQLRDQVMNSEKLICQECGKACSSKETMRKHQLIHTTTPSEHICEICGKSFRIKCQLSSHLAQHNQQLHKCSICNATFPSQWKLDVHAQAHKDVRPIECTICHARFFSRQTLRIHFYRHEGTEFKCPHCSKVLSTPFNLRNHMKIHLRETHKNFKCNLCNKFYYDYKDLTRHKKSHLDFRPHTCLKCNRAFKSKAHLKYHLNSHNNEGPVECEACGATFKKKYSFKQHLLKSKCRGAEGARGKKRERAKLRKMQEAQQTTSKFDGRCEEKLIEVNASDIEEHYVHDGLM